MNLILAVIIQAFIKIQKKELESEILNYKEIKVEDSDLEDENKSKDVDPASAKDDQVRKADFSFLRNRIK